MAGAGTGEGEGQGQGQGRDGAGIVWAILWILILIFFGWPIAFFIAGIWVCAMPFAVCISFCKDIMELLEKIVKLPQTIGEYIVAQKPLCD